jgi:MFS transporter, putative metabolite:H+ symporter
MHLTQNSAVSTSLLSPAVLVAALGYFVDIYDLLLFSIVRVPSLRSLGLPPAQITDQGLFLINMQMWGMLAGGIFWGILGDKRGRLSVLFGSIITYSLANIANGFVQTVEAYAFWRFVAGIGLAGELGAGITLVAETLPKEKRGYGTMIVATVGVSGAIAANLVYQLFEDWRTCYFIGGGLGMLLLLLRVSVVESGMFRQVQQTNVQKGNFLALFTSGKRFLKYLRCVLIGLSLWFVVGVLITFSPEFGVALGIPGAPESIKAGTAIAFCYGGLVLGDLASGLLSQWLRSRKKVMAIFLTLNLIMISVYLNAYGVSVAGLYGICLLMGFSVGFWVIFVTIAAEQFGTNLRATVTTTVPNLVRGSLPLLVWLFDFFRQKNNPNLNPAQLHEKLIQSGFIVGFLTIAVALLALWGMKETFSAELDYVEEF